MTKNAKRARITLEQKTNVVHYANAVKFQTDAAFHFNVSCPMINKIIKQSELITAKVDKSCTNGYKKSLKSAPLSVRKICYISGFVSKSTLPT
jgi:hypothetical protein